jgi:hypothetical protein
VVGDVTFNYKDHNLEVHNLPFGVILIVIQP